MPSTASLALASLAESAPLPPLQETLFGRTKTPAERLRQHQRALQKAQRELDRERSKLEQQEKKLIVDIKNSARKGEIVRPSPPLRLRSCRRPRARVSPTRAYLALVEAWTERDGIVRVRSLSDER